MGQSDQDGSRMALSKSGGQDLVQVGPYGPDKTERAVIATTDPGRLPDNSTWESFDQLATSRFDPGLAQRPASCGLGGSDQALWAKACGSRHQLQTGQTCVFCGPSIR
jgi:hypothetical protein